MVVNDNKIKEEVQENIKRIMGESALDCLELQNADKEHSGYLILLTLKNGMAMENISYCEDREKAIEESVNLIGNKIYEYEYYRVAQNSIEK